MALGIVSNKAIVSYAGRAWQRRSAMLTFWSSMQAPTMYTSGDNTNSGSLAGHSNSFSSTACASPPSSSSGQDGQEETQRRVLLARSHIAEERGGGVGNTLELDLRTMPSLLRRAVAVERSTDYESIGAWVEVWSVMPVAADNGKNEGGTMRKATSIPCIHDLDLHLEKKCAGEASMYCLPQDLSHALHALVREHSPGGDAHLELRVHAQVPERFCSVQVDICGHDAEEDAVPSEVHVASVTEASVRVRAGRGGAITLGRIRGGSLDVATDGGIVSASYVQANTVIDSRGGDVSLDRLQGATVQVSSGGGNITLGPSFAGLANIDSRGGHVRVASLGASDAARIDSFGGDVETTTGLLDGKVVIDAGAGNVRVSVAESAEEVSCETLVNASIECPSQSHIHLTLESGGGIELGDGMRLESVIETAHDLSSLVSNTKACSFEGTLAADDARGGWQGRIGATEFADDGSRRLRTVKLRVIAGGRVSLSRGSWFASIFRNKGVNSAAPVV